ncbi:hypothetical protein FS935_15405 [Metabacillus litoralis]|uniref:HPr domain-containing protein n=1 Tax=Metabacillus litoralis TaxID=152268 RepID=A0A5C6VWW3_9BACI|nr:hypothetical protein [Metabacillus litoralis]TXC89751.1 hypothetical protein FS935_15405 [Metabacillus litoralis]
MNKQLSINLQIENQLRIDQVIKINQLAKSYNGKIYLLTKNKSEINAGSLPTLITYLLTVKSGQVLSVVIDGPYPQLKLNDLKQICSSTVVMQNHRVLQPALKMKI